MLALHERLLSKIQALPIAPGLLIEISGPDARTFAATLLATYREHPAAWIEQNLNPFPDEVRRHPLQWDKVLFVDGKKDARWALFSLLQSGCFPFIVYYGPYGEDRQLRRLRKLAQRTHTMVLLLGEEPLPAWQIHCQYRTHNGQLELVRGRRL